jgi:diguanylate cyclase (GGDEF)-like protein/PAS domain S-box-containing protein
MKIGLKPLLSLVLLAVILIPAVAVVLTGISAAAQQTTQITTDEIFALSYAQSVGLDVLLDECVSSLLALSRFEEIKQSAGGNYNAVRDEVDSLFKSIRNEEISPYLLNIEVIQIEDGIVLIDAFGNAGAISPAFDEANGLGKNETVISDITIADPNYGGADTFYVVTRIESEESVYGYLSMVYEADIFINHLRKKDLFGGVGSFFMTDRKGTALWLHEAPVTRVGQIGSPALAEIVNATISIRRDIDTGHINSNTYINTYGTLSGNKNNVKNGWHWYGVYPIDAISTISMTLVIMITVVGGIVLMFVIAAFIIVRRVTMPPHDIVAKMRKINEGDMDERLDIKGTDEYAYISEAFNEMLDEVLISGKMHRTISELSDNMLFEWDFKREILFVSDNFREMFEVETEKATLMNGRFIESLMEKDDSERYKVDINKLLRNLGSMHGEYQVTTRTGSIIWVSVRSHCVLDRLGELLRVVGVITNINSEKLLSLQLSERASYDFLSGLYNRNTFMRELQSEITRSASSRVGVIFIDVDDFKMINDTYGHDTGDEIIKCVADIIKTELGDAGFAGRFGGDEFVMCVTREDTLNNINKLATAVLELFDKGYEAKKFDVTLKIKASLGIAIAPEHGRDNETVLAAADEAMYYVKKNGKSNFHIYNPEDSVLTELMHSI